MGLPIPERLVATCRQTPERSDWLSGLPAVVRELASRWSLIVGAPFDHDEVSCAWVAPVRRADGPAAVLKVSMPHFEAEHEIAGLRFWDGDPTVRLIDADERIGAMLLERCDPGTHLRELDEPQQDAVIADLLCRVWRVPVGAHPFRPLSVMTARWAEETQAHSHEWPNIALVQEGLCVLRELSQPGPDDVLLATDLHAGNVLRAQRAEWLVIDPKPFIGDCAYDATQHLLTCHQRLRSDAADTIQRFADQLAIDGERVRLWLFARAAAEPRDDWMRDHLTPLARAIAP